MYIHLSLHALPVILIISKCFYYRRSFLPENICCYFPWDHSNVHANGNCIAKSDTACQ